jgi:hypothetical protein
MKSKQKNNRATELYSICVSSSKKTIGCLIDLNCIKYIKALREREREREGENLDSLILFSTVVLYIRTHIYNIYKYAFSYIDE